MKFPVWLEEVGGIFGISISTVLKVRRLHEITYNQKISTSDLKNDHDKVRKAVNNTKPAKS